MTARLKAARSPFLSGKVLVIGDLIIDIRHQGGGLRESVESSAPIVAHETTHVSVGGAGFLVRNMLALGGNVTFLTLVGGDEYADFEKLLAHKRLKKVLIRDAKRHTTVKERFWSLDNKVLGWNTLDNSPISKKLQDQVLRYVKNNIGSFERVIISDYRHGLLPKTLAESVVKIAHAAKKEIYIDSQVSQHSSNHLWYAGADLFCINRKEAESIDSKFDNSKLASSLTSLQKLLKTERIILKRGELGSLSRIGALEIQSPASKIAVRDATGAGDAFFAVVALSKTIGPGELAVANKWAALKCSLVGTQTPDIKQL